MSQFDSGATARRSVVLQAKKILTQHIYGMVDRGERDEQRLTVCGLIHLKAVERDHGIKSAQDASNKKETREASSESSVQLTIEA
jgi:hypothetical protein